MEPIERFESLVGVRLSSHWLRACHHQLESTSSSGDNEGNAILHKILYSDLRDVVVHGDGVGNDNNFGGGEVLKKVIAQSLLSTTSTSGGGVSSFYSCKGDLPESFRCLFQVEELLDISLNAVQRLEVGPASASAPKSVGNQRNRCLKLMMSDGYEEVMGLPWRHLRFLIFHNDNCLLIPYGTYNPSFISRIERS